MSPVRARAQKTLALHNLHLNHYQESTTDMERGGGGVLKESRNEWQLESSVTIH